MTMRKRRHRHPMVPRRWGAGLTASFTAATTAEDTTVSIAVLRNDTDLDGDTLTVSSVTVPTHGTTAVNADGTTTYARAANFSGADSFSSETNDGTDDSDPATVSIAVNPVNDAPVADSDRVTTQSGRAVSITLEASDADGNALTYRMGRSPANGTLTGTGANRTCAPRSGFTNSDSFTFVANELGKTFDQAVQSDLARASLWASDHHRRRSSKTAGRLRPGTTAPRELGQRDDHDGEGVVRLVLAGRVAGPGEAAAASRVSNDADRYDPHTGSDPATAADVVNQESHDASLGTDAVE
jgi:hypothetical protein